MKRTVLAAVAAAITLSACSVYKPPKTYEFDKTLEFAMPFDQVWSAVVTWFAENSIPIKNIEKASGLVTTEYTLTSRTAGFADCGKEGFGQTMKTPTGTFNVLVMKIDEGRTKVTVNVDFRVASHTTSLAGSEYDTDEVIECVSTGKLEQEIFGAIVASSR